MTSGKSASQNHQHMSKKTNCFLKTFTYLQHPSKSQYPFQIKKILLMPTGAGTISILHL